MREWFQAGGWVMWFLTLVGGLSLYAALRFARRPDPAQLPRLQSLLRAVAWATLTGVAADLAAVGANIPARPEWAHSPDVHLLVLQGVSESLVPAILGGAISSVASLLIAAGHARLRSHGAPP
jgi:hypothetical protein